MSDHRKLSERLRGNRGPAECWVEDVAALEARLAEVEGALCERMKAAMAEAVTRPAPCEADLIIAAGNAAEVAHAEMGAMRKGIEAREAHALEMIGVANDRIARAAEIAAQDAKDANAVEWGALERERDAALARAETMRVRLEESQAEEVRRARERDQERSRVLELETLICTKVQRAVAEERSRCAAVADVSSNKLRFVGDARGAEIAWAIGDQIRARGGR